jgi:hypothetical protein
VDLDGDGVEEIVLARGQGRWARDPELLWFSAVPGRQTWAEHRVGRIGTEADDSPHDILPLSFPTAGGRLIRGIVVLVSRKRLVWYQVPDNLREPWARHEIGIFPASASQSGLAVGDIAGHGRPDMVCGMFWAECPADPLRQPWTIRRFGDWDANKWGGMAKLVLADVDGDGRREIVASEAEIPDSRLGIFQRDPAHPDGLWKCHLIDRGLYCPHSLLSVDLGQDGRPDLIVGEMTAGGWDFPLNPTPRILLYQNRGHLQFERRTLVEGWGVHEMAVAPARSDRKLRIFAADETQTQKFPQMQTHISSWTIQPASPHRR